MTPDEDIDTGAGGPTETSAATETTTSTMGAGDQPDPPPQADAGAQASDAAQPPAEPAAEAPAIDAAIATLPTAPPPGFDAEAKAIEMAHAVSINADDLMSRGLIASEEHEMFTGLAAAIAKLGAFDTAQAGALSLLRDALNTEVAPALSKLISVATSQAGTIDVFSARLTAAETQLAVLAANKPASVTVDERVLAAGDVTGAAALLQGGLKELKDLREAGAIPARTAAVMESITLALAAGLGVDLKGSAS